MNNMKTFFAAVLAIGLLAGTANAADYIIDTKGAHASINFRVKHLGFSWLTGRFDTFSGTFSFDPKNPAASKISLEIDTASVNSNHAKRDKHIRNADFLEVDKYPKATFVSTSMKVTGERTGIVKGNLTLRGITKEITIQAPDQDQGYLITVVQLPPGSSLARTDAVVQRATAIIRSHPEVANAVGFAGATFTNAPNAGAIFVPMKPIAERAKRGATAGKVLGELQAKLFAIQDAFVFLIAPPSVRGIGSGGGWKLYVQDRGGRGARALEHAARSLIGAANQDPGLSRVFSLFNTATPKIYADIDRVKAEILDVPAERVLEALEVFIGSAYVNDFNYLGRTYRVTAQADGPFRDRPDDVAKLRARSTTGAMVPIGSVATFRDITGPHRVPRYNLYPAAEVQGAKMPSLSTGEALARVEALAVKVLPDGFGFEWTELALQEKLAGDTAIIAFTLAVIFVFLLLAAMYESWLLPLAVILIVPMCLLAAIVGVGLRGMDSNILVQIGFVVLIGLAAKNAILIVEFAKQAEEDGMNRLDAAVEAARVRLRPILMTAFAFILGVVPLVIATGAGAEMRQALGTAVFSGMIGVTFFGLLFTPIFYVACRWLAGLRKVKNVVE